MMHGDAHPGNFMLMPDDRMGVIDFGAVAPLPGGLPIELGMMIRLARDKNYDLLLPTMEKVGFIQKGGRCRCATSTRCCASTSSPSRSMFSTTPASGCRR